MSHKLDNTQVWETRKPSDIKKELLSTTISSKRSIYLSVLFGVVALVGIVALFIKLSVDGANSTTWGYVATMTALLLGFSFGGPVVNVLSFIGKGVWGRTMARISTFFSLIGVVTAIYMIPLATQVPPLVVDDIRRRSVWYEAPIYSPQFWMIAGIVGLLIAGLAMFYISVLPDLAVMREHSTGWRKKMAKALAGGWVGSSVQWRSWRILNGSLGTIYILLGSFIIFLFATDFNMGIVPGWRDSLYPVSFLQTALQASLAAVVITVWIVRRELKLSTYFVTDHFWVLGRFLLAATLLWIYFFYSGFIVFWYGRSASDIAVLQLLVSGPTLWAMIGSALFSFVIPLSMLIWNEVRRSVNGPFVASISIIIGIVFERLRINLPAWSVPNEQIHERSLVHIPEIASPGVLDIVIMVGGASAIVAALMFAMRMIPTVSIWQTMQFNLMTKPAKFLRTKGVYIAKPD